MELVLNMFMIKTCAVSHSINLHSSEKNSFCSNVLFSLKYWYNGYFGSNLVSILTIFIVNLKLKSDSEQNKYHIRNQCKKITPYSISLDKKKTSEKLMWSTFLVLSLKIRPWSPRNQLFEKFLLDLTKSIQTKYTQMCRISGSIFLAN